MSRSESSAAPSTRRTSATSRSRGRRVEHFGLERLLVRVVADPGHKDVDAARRRAARSSRELAFARARRDEVELDAYALHGRLARGARLDDPVFLVGADEFAAFPTWKEPERVLELRGSASRRARVTAAAATRARSAARPDRVELFEIEPLPSRRRRSARARARRADRRSRAARGRRRDRRLGLYRDVDVRSRGTLSRAYDSGELTDLTSLEQARRIAALAQEKLATDVVILDMRPVCVYTDFFVHRAPGSNPRQTKAICDEVHERLKQDERTPAARGRRASARRRGSSPTTSTSSCTSSRRRRASSTGSRSSGATCPKRRGRRDG